MLLENHTLKTEFLLRTKNMENTDVGRREHDLFKKVEKTIIHVYILWVLSWPVCHFDEDD